MNEASVRGYYGGPRKSTDHATRPSREMQSVLRPHRAFAEGLALNERTKSYARFHRALDAFCLTGMGSP